MGVFGGIAGAKYSEGGVYLKPGVFRLEILAVKYIKTAPHSGSKDAFVVEFKVIESSNPDLLPGSLPSWMVTLDKAPALGNIKQFLTTAVEDATDEAITEAAVEYVVSPAQPLKGVIVRASAVNIKTKANRDFTKVKFVKDSAGAEGAMKEQSAAA